MPVKEVPTPEQEMNDRMAALESQMEHHANRLNAVLQKLSEKLKGMTTFLYGVAVGLLIALVMIL